MSETWWTGAFNHDDHDSTGQRAWCRCGEWCYAHNACSCCEKAALGDKTAAEVLDELQALTTRAEKAEAALGQRNEAFDGLWEHDQQVMAENRSLRAALERVRVVIERPVPDLRQMSGLWLAECIKVALNGDADE